MRKSTAKIRPLVFAILITPMLLLIAGLVFVNAEPSPILTSKTLWVGESAVNLLPVAGIKIFVNGGTIEQVSKQVDAPYYPSAEYDEIFIIAGVTDLIAKRKTEQEIAHKLEKLSEKLHAKYGVKPIIIDPRAVMNIFLDESVPRAPDGKHLSYDGSLLIVDLVKQELRKTDPFISDELLRQQYTGLD